MKEILVPSLAIPVGSLWRDLQENITADREFYIAAPLSHTPLPIYQWILGHANTFSNWGKVRFVLMDELEGKDRPFHYLAPDDPASYEGFALRNLLTPLAERIGITVPVVKPDLSRLESFHSQIDVLILALGVRGNYANVMPDTSESVGWHIAHLISEFQQTHTQRGAYAGATFREYGMSLGPQQVMAARNVVVIISGENKKELLKELKSYSSFNPQFPLSIIYHPQVTDRVTVYITPDAL